MFKREKEITVYQKQEYVWDFLVKYDWSRLMKEGKVTKETPSLWKVQLGEGDKANIQVVEATYDKNKSLIEIRITPLYNQHGTYDLLQLILYANKQKTIVKAVYEYFPRSISERVFAHIANHETELFDTAVEELFQKLNRGLMEHSYG